MFQHKSGYGPGEQYATHGRRRYRLTSKYPNPALPMPDPALWITHYYQADLPDRVPSSMIPLGDMRAQAQMQTRLYLQTQGQIVQKEFMLHDRASWPQIQFPRTPVRQPQFPVGATRTPQSMAYPTQQVGGNLGPPAKRARTQTNPAQGPPIAGAMAQIEPQDDEEDTTRGDIFDHMTPREVSMSRYKQNHEWMEEIMSSPYSISQIMPVDLGLGLRGELGSLTDGIFEAPNGLEHTQSEFTGRLDPVKADEFRKRTTDYIAKSNAELERMKAKHAKRMAKFKKGTLIAEAELQLKTAVNDPEDTGTEYWRLEGRVEDMEDEDSAMTAKTHFKVDDIVAKVEAYLGKHAVVVEEIRRIQDGGLQESQPEPSAPVSRQPSQNGSQQSGVLIGDGDLDMGGSAAGLLDQLHTGFSSTSTPGNNFPTPQPHLNPTSNAGTPSRHPSPQPSAHSGAQEPVATAPADKPMEDIDMEDASKDTQETNDWVVVPKGGVSPPATTQSPAATPAPSTFQASAPIPAPTTSVAEPALNLGPVDNNANANLDIPLGDNFTTDPTDFGSLEDLDTAGEALAGYGDNGMDGTSGHHDGGDMGGHLDLGLDSPMGLDDSAFGDAFHGVEHETRDVEAEGEGM
jgi:hypothetical protein